MKYNIRVKVMVIFYCIVTSNVTYMFCGPGVSLFVHRVYLDRILVRWLGVNAVTYPNLNVQVGTEKMIREICSVRMCCSRYKLLQL